VVAQNRGGLVEQLGDLGVGLALQELLEHLSVVAATGSDELLLDGGALRHKTQMSAMADSDGDVAP
jgi:hypothetical protein